MIETKASTYSPKNALVIIVGNYGSGKTEVAVNLATQLRRQGHQVSIADLDIVNPYFRCREAQNLMDAAGIRVVMPSGAQQFADLPIVVPEIKGMLQGDAVQGQFSIFDVGGDDVGATLLSSFIESIGQRPYSLLQVINTRRPFTDSVAGCLRMKADIERASRLKVTGLAVNTHLIEETTTEIILEGYELATQVARESGIDIEFVTAIEGLADLPEISALPVPILEIERIMLPPWLQAQQKDDRSNDKPNDVPAGRTKPLFVP